MRQNTWAENTIAFDVKDYDDDKSKLFSDVSKMLEILTTNGYECAFKYDDCGIYVLDYGYADPEMGCPMIYWLDNEQLDCLFSEKFIDEELNNEKE